MLLKVTIHRLLKHRHPWRHVSFDELSELYVSIFFRSLALSLVGIFVPVYLLQLGVGFFGVIVFFMAFFGARTFADFVGGFMVARFGPKHTMLTSYALQIIAASLLLSMSSFGLPLILPAVFWGAANSLFFMAFHVELSKIKHSEHGGKELAFMSIMEKTGGVFGPITGGIIATIFGPQFTFAIAIGLLLFGLIPLFQTGEPVKTHQQLHFHLLPYKQLRRDYVSHVAYMVEHNLKLVIWPVFLTLFVVTNNVYAEIGALTSAGILLSICFTMLIGKLIDSNHGQFVLRLSAVSDAALSLLRPFVTTLKAAFGVGMLSEVFTLGTRLPYNKAWYDAADDKPGLRIVYIVTMEATASYAKFNIWVLLFALSSLFGDRSLLTIGFIIAAIMALLITTEKYRSFRVH